MPARSIFFFIFSSLLLSSCNVPSYLDRKADRIYSSRGGATHQIQIGEVTMRYRTLGQQGTPILLIHGFGPNPKLQWTRQVKKLSKKHRLIVPELIYFGESRPTSQRRVYSLEYQADHLNVLLDSLGVEKTHLLGHSYGGLVGAIFCMQHPDRVGKVVLSGAPVKYYDRERADSIAHAHDRPSMQALLLPETGEDLSKLLEVTTFKPRKVKEQILDTLVASYFYHQRLDKLGLLDYLRRNEQFLNQLSYRIDKPVLLLWGAQDQLVPPEIGRRLQKHYGQKARLELIENAGHSVNSEKARRFNRAVVQFLDTPKQKKKQVEN